MLCFCSGAYSFCVAAKKSRLIQLNTAPALVEALKNFFGAQQQRKPSDAQERVIELIASGLPPRPRMETTTRRAFVQQYNAANREIAARFDVTALVQTSPPERIFGEWQGLGDTPPLDHESVPKATPNNLFSRDFVTMVIALAERFGAMDAALAQAQTLAIERHLEIESLHARLDQAHHAAVSRGRTQPNANLIAQHGYLGTLRFWLRSRF